MGNRVNIGITSKDNGTVQVYAHWLGEESAATLANALDRGRGRWHDDSYLTRIIVSEFVNAIGWNEETGMGLSGRRIMGPDDLTVYMDPNGVGYVKIGKHGVGDGHFLAGHAGKHTFEAFIDLVKQAGDPRA